MQLKVMNIVYDESFVIVSQNADSVDSTNTQNLFNNIVLAWAGLFRYKGYNTPLTFTEGRFAPIIFKNEATVFEKIRPRAPRLLNTVHIISPDVFGK